MALVDREWNRGVGNGSDVVGQLTLSLLGENVSGCLPWLRHRYPERLSPRAREKTPVQAASFCAVVVT